MTVWTLPSHPGSPDFPMMPVRRATGDRAGCGTVPMRNETSQQERTHPVVTKWYETRRGAPECRPLWVRTSARRVAGSGRDTYITNRTQRIDSPRAPKSPANGYDRELPMRPTRNGDCKRRPGRATGIAPDGWSDTKGDRSLSPPNTRLPVGSQDRAWSVAGDLGQRSVRSYQHSRWARFSFRCSTFEVHRPLARSS